MGFNAIGHDFCQIIPLIIRYFPIIPNTRQHGASAELQLCRQLYLPRQRSRTPGQW